jgi:hypothetical protein
MTEQPETIAPPFRIQRSHSASSRPSPAVSGKPSTGDSLSLGASSIGLAKLAHPSHDRIADIRCLSRIPSHLQGGEVSRASRSRLVLVSVRRPPIGPILPRWPAVKVCTEQEPPRADASTASSEFVEPADRPGRELPRLHPDPHSGSPRMTKTVESGNELSAVCVGQSRGGRNVCWEDRCFGELNWEPRLTSLPSWTEESRSKQGEEPNAKSVVNSDSRTHVIC